MHVAVLGSTSGAGGGGRVGHLKLSERRIISVRTTPRGTGGVKLTINENQTGRALVSSGLGADGDGVVFLFVDNDVMRPAFRKW